MEDKSVKRITLFIVTLAAFLTPFDGSAINIALPTIGREFSMNAVSLGWVATSYLLSTSIFLLLFGRVADIYGRKKIYAWGLAVFTTASLCMIFTRTSAGLIFFRVIQGIGGAMIFSNGMALVSSVFPPQERGKALGIIVSATYTGLSIGPFLGGFLTSNFGWRSIFMINVPIGIIVVILIITRLKTEWADAKGEKIDVTGAVIYGLGMISIIYGLSSFSNHGPLMSSLLFAAGIVLTVIFCRWELKQKNPLLEIRLFRHNRTFAMSNLAALINYCTTFAITFFVSLYLQYIKGFDAQTAGIIMISQPVIMAVGSPFAGRLSDSIEPRSVASTGMSLTAIGLFLISFMNSATSIPYIIAVLVLIGIGYALFSSPNSNAVMGSVEKKFYGMASGTLATMRLTGQMFSMGFAVLITSIFIGNAKITPEYYPAFLLSMKTAFIFFGIICTGGVVASYVRGNVR